MLSEAELHFVGTGEAYRVGVNTLPPSKEEIAVLSREYGLRMELLFSAKVENISMLSLIDAMNGAKQTVEVLPVDARERVQMIFIAFTSGWNAYYQQSHVPDQPVKEFSDVFDKWCDAGQPGDNIGGYQLSETTAIVLKRAMDDRHPKGLQHGGEVLEMEVTSWMVVIEEAVKDGWNAARMNAIAQSN